MANRAGSAGPRRTGRRQTGLATGAVASVALAAISLSACGGGSNSNGEAKKSPTQILADAKAATNKASSVRVSGSLSQGGSTTTLDLAVANGTGGGTIAEAGESFQILVHPPKLYLRASPATWTKLSNAATAQLLANKWIETASTNKDFASFDELLDLSKLTAKLTPSGTLVKDKTTTFHGQAAVGLTDQGSRHGTLYVAATGPAYILGITGGGANRGTLLFSNYDTVKIPAAPAGAVNLDQLEKG